MIAPFAWGGLALLIWFVTYAVTPNMNYARWDNFECFVPLIAHAHESWLSGIVPFLNFHQHLGEVFMATSQEGLFYFPFTLALLIQRFLSLPIERLVDIILGTHLPFAVAGVFLVLRKLRVRHYFSGLFSLSICFSGHLFLMTGVWISSFPIFVWTPWLLLGCIHCLEFKRPVLALWLVTLSSALLWWVGNPQYTLYALLGVNLLALGAAIFIYRSSKGFALFLISEILGWAFSGPEFFSSLSYMSQTIRKVPLALTYFLDYGATPQAYLGLISPLLKLDNGFWSESASPHLFQGGALASLILLSPLFVFLYCRRRPSNTMNRVENEKVRWAGILAFVTLVFVAFSLGEHTPIYPSTYGLPVWSSLRWPFKFLLFANFSLGLFGALATEILFRTGLFRSRAIRIWAALIPVILFVGLTLLFDSPLFSKPSSLTIVAAILLTMIVFPWADRKWGKSALLALTILNSLAVVAFTQEIDLKSYPEKLGTIGAEALGIDPAFRILPISSPPNPRLQEYGVFFSATANHYFSLTGHASKQMPLLLRRDFPTNFWGTLTDWVPSEILSSHFLKALNVGYFIAGVNDSGATARALSVPGIRKVKTLSETAIFKNEGALRRAFFATELKAYDAKAFQKGLINNQSSPTTAFVEGLNKEMTLPLGSTVLGEKWREDGVIRIDITSPLGGFLVISVLALPGWSSWVDGKQTVLYRTDRLIWGTFAPPGAKTIELHYTPPGWNFGLWILAFGLLSFFGLTWFLRKKLGYSQMQSNDSNSDRLRAGSPDRFGYEWETYGEVLPESKGQLERWLGSTGLSFFKDHSVLDVGCGMGRNSYWIARAGAKHILAVDIDDRCVATTTQNLRTLSNTSTAKISVYALSPTHPGTFDRVVCIGVLHHLGEPKAALQAMWSCVNEGGSLILWCYGNHGNRLLLPMIQGLRSIISLLPLPMARVVSALISRITWPLFKTFPWRTQYYRNLKTLSYRNFESIVFDQLIPRVSHYWTEPEMRALLKGLSGEIFIEAVQGNSWHVKMTKTKSG